MKYLKRQKKLQNHNRQKTIHFFLSQIKIISNYLKDYLKKFEIKIVPFHITRSVKSATSEHPSNLLTYCRPTLSIEESHPSVQVK